MYRLMNKKLNQVLAVVLTIVALMTGQTTWAQSPATIGSISYNSTLGAYEIASADNLHDLAVYVNGSGTYSDNTTKNSTAHDCTGLTFKLTGNIELAHTTAWNDTYSTEENYTPIGRGAKTFKGTFDGCGYTISGIRIYRTGQNNEVVDFLGLFGQIEGTVQNVTVSDARITGRQIIGGISGDNWQGTISNCTVTNTVCIHSRQNNAHTHGGIVGRNYSDTQDAIVSGCTSSVQFTMTDYLTGIGKQGGIVGWNRRCSSGHDSVISNCLVLGATIMTNYDDYAKSGAIIGEIIDSGDISNAPTNNIGTLTNNYYSNCTVSNYTSSATTNIGAGNTSGVPGDVTDNDGARGVGRITLPTDVSVTNGTSVTIGSTTYYYAGGEITLSANRESYTLVGYSSEDVTISEGGTFTMPTSDVTVNATWKKLLTNTDITIADIPAQTYNGSALTPAVTVTDGTTELTKDTHYTVTLPEGRINAGDYTITITGIGDYDGNTTKMFTITPAPLTVTTGSASKVYDRTALTKDEAEIIGLVNGETATITATGSQTDVGSSDNTYNITWDGTAVSTNYNITTETLGTLTVFPITIAAREAATNEYWTTYYNRIANLQVDASTTVYKAAVNTATNRVDLTEITDRIIKASQGVVLKSTHQNITATPVTDASSDSYSNNELLGVDAETAQTSGKTYYVLSKPAGKELGFYKLSNTVNLGAHKAYLEVASVNNAPAFFGFGGSGENTTAINEHESHQSHEFTGDYYTLDGRKLQGKPTQKGIYVRNGRKIIIK